MKRLIIILVLICLSFSSYAQEETGIVDSLLSVLPGQEGREKVKTMIELTWEFYEVSYDDCIEWGEKAIAEAQVLGYSDLEADATYALGMQYGYHADLDLAQLYLKKAFVIHKSVGNENRAFEDLWNRAYFEQLLGSIDSSYVIYEDVLSFAEQRGDTLAMANTYANMATIQYQRNDLEGAVSAFLSGRAIYETFNETAEVMTCDLNLATIYGECGKYDEARRLFIKLIPWYEANKGYEALLLAYKNYGLLFERDLINYDSANHYFEKALSVIEQASVLRAERQTMANSKADVLTELGNVATSQNLPQKALKYYEEALSLAEGSGYHFGQMQAMLGLGELYAKMGQAAKSLYYLERYSEEASRSGITLMESAVRKALIIDYARLGRFAEMESELNNLDEQRLALSRENADISYQNRELKDEVVDLISQHDSQNNQIQILQTERDHYRLAFFGIMAIVIFALCLCVAYKIVRKNRAKSVKP